MMVEYLLRTVKLDNKTLSIIAAQKGWQRSLSACVNTWTESYTIFKFEPLLTRFSRVVFFLTEFG